MAFNSTNAVAVGNATKKDHYDRVFDNTLALYAGAMAQTSQAIGDLIYASSTTQLGRIAAVAVGQVLISAGVGVVPAYSATLPTAVQDNITRLGTVVTVAAFTAAGTHSFSATAGTFNKLVVRQENVGVACEAAVSVGNDTDADLTQLRSFSSTFTEATYKKQNGGVLLFSGAGGGAIVGTHASGVLRFFTNTLERGSITAAGLLAWTTFGSHTFTAGGTGAQKLTIQNTTAGPANESALSIGTDADGDLAQVRAFTSTYTTDGHKLANAASFVGSGAGGTNLVATHASGDIKFWAGGNTKRGTMFASGGFSWGDATDPGATNFRVAGTSTLVGAVTCSSTLSATAITATTAFRAADGSVGTPSISFTNDTDTGIYSAAANSLGVTAGGLAIAQFFKSGATTYPIFTMVAGAFGAGIRGAYIQTNRNTSGSGAAGSVNFIGKGGASNYVWADASGTPGKLRILPTDPPVEDGGSTSDTSGTVVGDQTSWHAYKRVIRQHTDPRFALDAVLATRVYDFDYGENGSYLDPDGKAAVFTGFVGYDRNDWFLKNVGPQQTPCLNEINAIGYLTLAVQALHADVDQLRHSVH